MIASTVTLDTDYIGAIIIASNLLGACIGIWISNRDETIRRKARKQDKPTTKEKYNGY